MVFGGTRRRGQSILQCQRIALYTEGKEGEQHSPRDVHPISRLSTTHPPNGCCMSSRITPKQTGTGLNPTENTFGGDPEEMFKRALERSRLNIYACKKLNHVPVGFNAFLVLEGGVIHATARDTSSCFRRGGEQSRGKGLQVFRHVLKCRCRQGERRRVASPAIGGE